MIRLARCAALVFVAATFAGLTSAADEREGRPRFKGVELYSWKDADGRWLFALLDGTNRSKTANAIKVKANQIAGVAKLKKALARLAEGENVSWTHRVEGFEYPPTATIKDITAAAKKVKVKVRVPEKK